MRNAQPRVRIGFIPLVDSAPLLVAEALGFFARQNVEVELSREVGWATIREKILHGQLDAAHALAGLAISLRLGLDGVSCSALAPFVMNLHGNAITLSMDLWQRGVRDGVTLHKLIRSTPQRLFTFAVVARSASHNFLMRRWLKQGGINPDRDVRLVVLPPTQMPGSLRAGLIDGYCVGEPWNSVAVADGSGWCPAISEDLAPGHPEKILLTTEEFAKAQPAALGAVIRALHEACAYCDDPKNRAGVIDLLLASGHMRAEREILKLSLAGPFDNGAGERRDAENFHIFHRNKANVPSLDKADWVVRSFVEHGLIAEVDATAARRAMSEAWRPDLYHEALDFRKTARRRTTPATNLPKHSAKTTMKQASKKTPSKTTSKRGLKSAILRHACAALAFLSFATAQAAETDPLDLEKDQLKLGFIKLTDCAPLVIAKEKGFFEAEGLIVDVEAQANWKVLLDRVISGELDGAHMLAGQPIGATIGFGTKADVITPVSLDYNGNAITVSNAVWAKMKENLPKDADGKPVHPISAKAFAPIVQEAKASGKPLQFGMVFPVSTHNYELRYWLAAGGINPGYYFDPKTGEQNIPGVLNGDLVLSVTPPPQMPSTLEAGTIVGYCVGEPWNQQAVFKKIGVPVVTDHQIWAYNPEKVFGITKAFAEKNPNTTLALTKAIIRACAWLDESMDHRKEAVEILSHPNYVGADAEVIANSMTGTFEFESGDKRPAPDFNVFFKHFATYPWASDCIWYLTQMVRWGQVPEQKPDDWYFTTAKSVYRSDLYEAAAKLLIKEGFFTEADFPLGSDGFRPATSEFIDGKTYDGRKPNDYVKSLEIGLK